MKSGLYQPLGYAPVFDTGRSGKPALSLLGIGRARKTTTVIHTAPA
jgi:hypothetical protein